MSRRRSLSRVKELALINDKTSDPTVLNIHLAAKYGIHESTVSRILTKYYESLGVSIHGNTLLTADQKQTILFERSCFPSLPLKFFAYRYNTSVSTISRLFRREEEKHA